jgi:hypothetical protein
VDAGPSSITSRWSTHRTSFRERAPLWDGGGKRLTEEVVELDAAGHPGLFWVNSWLPVPVSPPAEPGRATTAPPSTRRQRSRRWPGRPSRSQPTTLLSRESACQAVGHWLHHSLLQLHTTRPIEYPVRWFAVLGGRVAHCVGGGAGGQVTIAATPSVESMASLSLARVASLDAGQRTVTTRSRWC